MTTRPDQRIIDVLAAVQVESEQLKQAAQQGRQAREAFEVRIAALRNVTADDLKSRSR